ncbi:MarR family winged helix-turn-helix transcriptional regulator [Spirosoma montaniterrae]|uniref:Transcriptional regulator n=1 Tax=Spirosoma montaniterrae TaxID=1178516 RepID=A0A1P9WWV9_9BACT|nr:MarR family transcriptional regulator [Spirosoma montaniterrae]AQG79866.1 transcriptional regulator [Spirosoma montaniterrae]
MSIEADIKQTIPFKSPYHRVMVNLIYTSNWVADSQTRMLKPFGLTLQQYNVLRILRGQFPNPVKVSDITERMLDKMSNASRLVDKLVAKKLVLRTECPSDRRAVDVVITDAGLALLKRLDVYQGEWDTIHRDKLTEDEAVQLSHLLDRLRQ